MLKFGLAQTNKCSIKIYSVGKFLAFKSHKSYKNSLKAIKTELK